MEPSATTMSPVRAAATVLTRRLLVPSIAISESGGTRGGVGALLLSGRVTKTTESATAPAPTAVAIAT